MADQGPGRPPDPSSELVSKIKILLRELSSTPHVTKSHASPGGPPTKKGFMDLPRELRDMIYGYALVIDHPIDLWPAFQGSGPEEGPSSLQRSTNIKEVATSLSVGLLRASKKVHREASPIFYGSNAFHFSNNGAPLVLEAFLYTIGTTNRKNVKHLGITHALRGTQYQYREEVRRLSGILSEIKLQMPTYEHQIRRYPQRRTKSSCPEWDALDDVVLAASKGRLAKLSVICTSEDFWIKDVSLGPIEQWVEAMPDLSVDINLSVRRMPSVTAADFAHKVEDEWTEIRTRASFLWALQYGWSAFLNVIDETEERSLLVERRVLTLADCGR